MVTTAYLYRLAGESMALGYRGATGYEARLRPDASLVLSGEPVADLNYAIISSKARGQEYLHEFVQVARARKVPVIFLFASNVGSHLTAAASNLGLEYAEKFPFMVLSPENAPSMTKDCQIKRAEDKEGIKAANAAMAAAFNIPAAMVHRAFGPLILESPGLEIFVANQDGNTVSALQTTRNGPYVGIWSMATPPEHQRQGIGRALITWVIAYHCQKGAKIFYLGATPAGKPLYEKVGFETADEAQVWVFNPEK